MPRVDNKRRLAAIVLSAAVFTSAQTNGASPSSTASPSNAITSSPSSTTASATSATSDTDASMSADVPLSLWGVANSLLTSYYPSTSLTAINTLTWPTAVVVGSSTYSVHPAATDAPTTTSALAEQTGSPSSASPKPLRSDQKLGVVLGVVIGAIVLAIITFIFCFLTRRKKATGSYFKRRPPPSISDSDAGAWRTPQRFVPTSMRGSQDSDDYYNRLPEQQQAPPPMAMHPAYVRQYSSRSTSEDNPFMAPQERTQAPPAHDDFDGAGMPFNGHHADHTYYRRSPSPMQEGARPPTPFSPTMMMVGGGMQQHPHYDGNPFASPEDEYEGHDMISPIIPTRSPERRYSPTVHYPSWHEVSEFDFSGNGMGRSGGDQTSSEDSWQSARNSMTGRHELA